jgi:hypothetical protein
MKTPSKAAVWSVCAAAFGSAGLVGALATWGWPGPTAAILTLAFLVVVIAAAVLPENGPRVLPGLAWKGVVAGTVLTAASGLIAMLGALGLLVTLLLTLTAPGLRACLRRGWGFLTDRGDARTGEQRAEPAGRVPAEAPPRDRASWLPEALEGLDEVSLCMAWRSSFIALEAAATLEDRLVVIEHRQRCLDELQRRNPRGVAAWLSSGARASGNPLPFLGIRQDDQPELP